MGKRQRGTAGFIAVTGAACALYALSAGLRSVYGILLGAIAQHTGIAYASVSFVIAVGQLVFGVAQPVFGVVALKKSNAFVLLCGCVLMAAGLAMIPFCAAAWALMLFFGILLPAGTGAVSFGILMSAITPRLGERRAATAAGFVNASSGLGSIVLSPLLQTLFSTVGFSPTMLALGLFSAALVPVTLWTGRPDSANSAQAANGPARESLLRLLRGRCAAKATGT